MSVVRSICGFVLLSIFYVGSLVLAFSGLKVALEDTTIVAGQQVVIHAEVSDTLGEVDYDWYIDGTPLAGVSTPGLDLSWEVYIELFPEDKEVDSIRSITLEATDAFGTSSDTATLSIIHEPVAVCGDGEINYSIGEECDDGNKKSGDGCSEMCWCEGMCIDLLMSTS